MELCVLSNQPIIYTSDVAKASTEERKDDFLYSNSSVDSSKSDNVLKRGSDKIKSYFGKINRKDKTEGNDQLNRSNNGKTDSIVDKNPNIGLVVSDIQSSDQSLSLGVTVTDDMVNFDPRESELDDISYGRSDNMKWFDHITDVLIKSNPIQTSSSSQSALASGWHQSYTSKRDRSSSTNAAGAAIAQTSSDTNRSRSLDVKTLDASSHGSQVESSPKSSNEFLIRASNLSNNISRGIRAFSSATMLSNASAPVDDESRLKSIEFSESKFDTISISSVDQIRIKVDNNEENKSKLTVDKSGKEITETDNPSEMSQDESHYFRRTSVSGSPNDVPLPPKNSSMSGTWTFIKGKLFSPKISKSNVTAIQPAKDNFDERPSGSSELSSNPSVVLDYSISQDLPTFTDNMLTSVKAPFKSLKFPKTTVNAVADQRPISILYELNRDLGLDVQSFKDICRVVADNVCCLGIRVSHDRCDENSVMLTDQDYVSDGDSDQDLDSLDDIDQSGRSKAILPSSTGNPLLSTTNTTTLDVNDNNANCDLNNELMSEYDDDNVENATSGSSDNDTSNVRSKKYLSSRDSILRIIDHSTCGSSADNSLLATNFNESNKSSKYATSSLSASKNSDKLKNTSLSVDAVSTSQSGQSLDSLGQQEEVEPATASQLAQRLYGSKAKAMERMYAITLAAESQFQKQSSSTTTTPTASSNPIITVNNSTKKSADDSKSIQPSNEKLTLKMTSSYTEFNPAVATPALTSTQNQLNQKFFTDSLEEGVEDDGASSVYSHASRANSSDLGLNSPTYSSNSDEVEKSLEVSTPTQIKSSKGSGRNSPMNRLIRVSNPPSPNTFVGMFAYLNMMS